MFLLWAVRSFDWNPYIQVVFWFCVIKKKLFLLCLFHIKITFDFQISIWCDFMAIFSVLPIDQKYKKIDFNFCVTEFHTKNTYIIHKKKETKNTKVMRTFNLWRKPSKVFETVCCIGRFLFFGLNLLCYRYFIIFS